jgi:hypothetical protein
MSRRVISWPPVCAIGSEWSWETPRSDSRSIFTGADRGARVWRERRLASLTARGVDEDGMGSGYMEMLKRHLGGVDAVRLYSYPIDWFLNAQRDATDRQSTRLFWTADASGLDWSAGAAPLLWYDGRLLTGTTDTDAAGWPIITVSGLRPSRLVARPGEFLTAFADHEDMVGTTVQITAPARSNSDGVAVIRLFEALPDLTDARVNIGVADTGAFLPVGEYPRAVQNLSGDWSYSWSFREVFPEEVGGFVEVNPWA